jgi:O-antigen/teichoic acid export membrane protein
MLGKVLHVFTTSLIIAALTFLTTALLSRYFGAQGMGEIGFFLFSNSLVMVALATFGSSSIVYVAAKHTITEVFIVSTIATFAGALLICGLVYFVPWFDVNVIWLLVVAILQALYVNMLFLLMAINRPAMYDYARVSQPVLLLVIIMVVIITKGPHVDYYYYALTSSYLIPSVCLFFYLKQYFHLRKKLKFKALKTVAGTFFKFGGLSQLTNGIQLLNYRVSLLFIGLFCSQKDLGVMVLALTFVDGIWIFKNSAGLIKYVDTSQKQSGEGQDHKKDIFLLSALSFSITLIVALAVILMPDQLYHLIFGKDFQKFKTLIIYMLPGVLVVSLRSIIANYFAGIGKVTINLTVAFISLCTFLPSVYFLTQKYGIVGAAVANNVPNLLGSLVLFYFYFTFTKRRRAKATV